MAPGLLPEITSQAPWTFAESPDGVVLDYAVAQQHQVNAFAYHPGGCYTCRWFGERVDVAVWCAHPGNQHLRSQAERGCAFWQREPGADYE